MFIYIKHNKDWSYENKFKYGYTTELIDRFFADFTYHSTLSKYIAIYEIDITDARQKIPDKIFSEIARDYNKIRTCEITNGCKLPYICNLKNHLVDGDAGREFVIESGVDIIDKIILHEFKYFNIKLIKKFNDEEIKTINIAARNKQTVAALVAEAQQLGPRAHQIEFIDKALIYYKENKHGKLIWAPGTGKTLAAIYLMKECAAKKILFAVPRLNLQEQLYREIECVFTNTNNIKCIGSGINSTTDAADIKKFMSIARDHKIIITTFESCHLLTDYYFDFKIADESHHLVKNSYPTFHNIVSDKTLFMTATEKYSAEGYCMSNAVQFGKIIDERTVKWAIDEKIITDHVVLIIENTDEEIIEIISQFEDIKNIRLFMAAYATLKAMEIYDDFTHSFIYLNNTENADLTKQYIDIILNKKILKFNSDGFYNKALHSKIKISLHAEKADFIAQKRGIISCVEQFGEGTNVKELNGVSVAENIESEVKVIQYLLRAHRKCEKLPNKKAYIILPYILSDKKSMSKIINILMELRNIDENIISKVNCSKLVNRKNNKNENEILNIEINNDCRVLELIKLKVEDDDFIKLGLTREERRYRTLKKFNKGYNICSRENYYENKDLFGISFIEDPKKEFLNSWRGWYDFLNYDTSLFIQNIDDWKKYCNELKIYDRETYEKINDVKLPKMPDEFYVDFISINYYLNNKQRKLINKK
jgi:superfamily II DNA or RNA helicase